jgi:hypothetical protein
MLAPGFLVRLGWSAWGFLNPDEAAHYLLSVQTSIGDAYRASLTTAHPPLLILLLHCWQRLGHSEIVLRLPSVIAGTLFCWVMFLWIERVTQRSTAVVALALLLFSPSLIGLSAEVRQYSLLLAFAACSLYWLERAVGEDSAAIMVGSFVALYLAMLTHYSSLILSLALGIYGVFRLYGARCKPSVKAAWGSGQAVGIALALFLYFTHVAKLRDRNLPQQIADTWLRNSIFHRKEESVLSFLAKGFIRVFHFQFANNVIGVIGLALFLAGIAALYIAALYPEASYTTHRGRPSSRLLGTFLLLPFFINCAVAIAGLYPFGGTRHNAVLAGFGMCGISIGLSAWKPSIPAMKPMLIALSLLICNVFPSPAGAYIRPENQERRLMEQATDFVRQSVPAGSTVFTDYQSGLLLSYYLCEEKVVQFEPPFQPLVTSNCGNVRVISTYPKLWIFEPDTFPQAFAEMKGGSRNDGGLWVFQAGWLVNDEPVMRKQLQKYGCREPKQFGENILACEMGEF